MKREVPVGRWSAEVSDDGFVCGSCGERFYLPGQLQATLTRAAEQVRRDLGIVAPERILALRARYGLTQVQLEQLLGVSAKMVVRWERGTVLPTLATSRLIEVLDSVPESVFRKLAAKHGVKVTAA